ncbi:2-oxo-hepta-3-ene-1,7-dioic acid hydratase [Bradyrhizobium sp. 200]|uniref:2-oxo-hept-4-ene-1,7-dioate hydratase n=1 Tax=Bradyrhizobium sp. 200 TaxID=2782665 RepID=UPI001FFFF2B0|nr:2-oxo-hepta-3-ene-1,7-dioic acid hydratase [Bradyrhizobium sp. 200]UPJ54478.1 2-oxo-hepta-3-ene-1,7-dioic acid hydratase [Bradyrhizobium sp. 200]
MHLSELEQAARNLVEAEKTRKQMRQFSLSYSGMTVDEAYAIQAKYIDIRMAEGRSIKGHKIGLTSRAMQIAAGLDEPDYGVLLNDMFVESGGTVEARRFIVPRVEVELAFLLKRDLSGPGCSIFDVYNAAECVVPAIEILDARLHRIDPETKHGKEIVDTISDNAGNAALVLGGRPFKPDETDLRWIAAICYRNGRVEETGGAAGVLNNPATGVAWLANKLWRHGVTLRAGEVLLSGSFIRPIDALPGDVFHADFKSYGVVTCRFEEEH